MANSDILITQAAPYGPDSLDQHKQLAILALGLYSLANAANVATSTTGVKSYVQNAVTALRGIPREKLLADVSAIIWAGVDIAGTSDLANVPITTKTQSVVYAYLNALDDDALYRLIVYEFGIALSILT